MTLSEKIADALLHDLGGRSGYDLEAKTRALIRGEWIPMLDGLLKPTEDVLVIPAGDIIGDIAEAIRAELTAKDLALYHKLRVDDDVIHAPERVSDPSATFRRIARDVVQILWLRHSTPPERK